MSKLWFPILLNKFDVIVLDGCFSILAWIPTIKCRWILCLGVVGFGGPYLFGVSGDGILALAFCIEISSHRYWARTRAASWSSLAMERGRKWTFYSESIYWMMTLCSWHFCSFVLKTCLCVGYVLLGSFNVAHNTCSLSWSSHYGHKLSYTRLVNVVNL